MTSKLGRILLTVALIGGSIGYLMYSTMSKDTEYYKHVDEVMNTPQAWYGKRLQLHGFVVDNSILVNDKTLEYRFNLQNNGQVVTTAYRGVVPDTFKSGAEVVVTGRLDGAGFHAETMTAKCPSKYNPKDGNPAGKANPATTAGGTE
jgi:cytochrome c-type biogenesis protein CcmE